MEHRILAVIFDALGVPPGAETEPVLLAEIEKQKRLAALQKDIRELDDVRAQIQAETAKEQTKLQEVVEAAAKAAAAYTAVRTALWLVS